MILIGLCGAAGSGKDTVASHLESRHGFKVLAFAGPLYEAVSAITGMNVGDLRDRQKKEKPIEWIGKSPRELLQLMGTEFGRNMIHEDIWVTIAMRAMREARRRGLPGAVVTDVRFDNEAEAIREEGGLVFEVARRGARCLADGAAKHKSEAGIDRQHIFTTITNDGTIGDLSATVDAVMGSLHADIM